MNEEVLRAIAAKLSAARQRKTQAPVMFSSFGHYLAGTWASAVAVECALQSDDMRQVRYTLGRLGARVLIALHDLDVPWALRTPLHRPGRYATAADLTAGLRRRLSDVWRYFLTAPERDAVIALELVLKEAMELASTLDFDLVLELSAHEHTPPI